MLLAESVFLLLWELDAGWLFTISYEESHGNAVSSLHTSICVGRLIEEDGSLKVLHRRKIVKRDFLSL